MWRRELWRVSPGSWKGGERCCEEEGGGKKKNLRSVAEEEYHYQCVWETHFGTVYKAVSEALNDGEDVMVFGVKYESVYRCLGGLAVVSEGLCGGVLCEGRKECTKIISMVLAIATGGVCSGETRIGALESV